jgi:energy-coupling factor transporter ATP-binding protein EcfA2
MISFAHITFSYDRLPVLRDVSFSVGEGERVALLGANGSGKSTLAHLANGTLLPQDGTVIVDGRDTADDTALPSLRARIGMVEQDPETQIVASCVQDEVAFGPENLGLPPEELASRVCEALQLVGLSGFEQRDPATLSGGEQQRLVIAGAYAMQPHYLVFDEPTSMLDTSHRREVAAIIDSLHERGQGILHITHDLADCLNADRILVLEQGSLVFEGDFDALVACQERWASWGLAASPLLAFEMHLRAQGSPLLWTTDVSDLAAQLGLERRAAPDEAARHHLVGGELASEAQTVLSCHALSYGYEEDRAGAAPALEDVSFEMSAGDLLIVAGQTGSGKSTLLRLLAGLYTPQEGTVLLEGSAPLPGLTGYVFQSPESQLFAETVAEDILFGARNCGRIERGMADHAAEEVLVAEALAAVGLDASLSVRSPFDMSGGQARRVAIAGVLALRPRLLLLDEPTAGLDATGRAFVHRLIAEERARGTLVVVVTHDYEEFLGKASTLLTLRAGRLAAVTSDFDAETLLPVLEQAGLCAPPLLELEARYGLAEAGELR